MYWCGILLEETGYIHTYLEEGGTVRERGTASATSDDSRTTT